MGAGKPGDDPLTDIVYWKQLTYSEQLDAMVRDLEPLCNDRQRRELADRLATEFCPSLAPNLSRLREWLETRTRQLATEGKTARLGIALIESPLGLPHHGKWRQPPAVVRGGQRLPGIAIPGSRS